MALISMAVFDTEENQRTELTKKTICSLAETVDFTRHRLIVVDNASCPETKQFLIDASSLFPDAAYTVLTNDTNTGTARAVNRGWARRKPGEVVVKMDNDVVIHHKGWLDEIEAALKREAMIGICGLKRKDCEESPLNQHPFYHSDIRMLAHKPGERWIVVEEVQHVMGTCQAFSPALIDRIGYMWQMGGLYGFDDVLASLRAHCAGFRTVFLPHIEIDHIDPGTTPFQKWKEEYAGKMMSKFHETAKALQERRMPLLYVDEEADAERKTLIAEGKLFL